MTDNVNVQYKSFKAKHKCTLTEKYEDLLPRPAPFAPFKQKMLFNMKMWLIVSRYNVLTSRYFRSRGSILKEKRRQFKSNNSFLFSIHPFSRFNAVREIVMSVVWALNLILTPIHYSFLGRMFGRPDDENYYSRLQVLVWFINLFLVIDIFVCFNMGYRSKGKQIILDKKMIFLHYLRTYFFIDVIPTSYSLFMIFHLDKRWGVDHSLVVLGSSLLLLRAIRVCTWIEYTCRILAYFSVRDEFITCFMILLSSFMFIHWGTCILYCIPNINYYLTKFFGNSYILSISVGQKRDKFNLYLEIFLCVCNHFFTGGKANATPNSTEKIILGIITVYGFCFNIIAAAIYLQLFGAINISGNKFDELMHQTDQYMTTKQVPRTTKKRVFQYFDYKYQKSYFHEDNILKTLSEHLRCEVLLYSCQNLINKVDVFQGLPKNVIGTALTLFRPEVYLPNDVIITYGRLCEHIYFISHGTVAVYKGNGNEIIHLEDGAHFGDLPLFLENEPTYGVSVVAIEITSVYYITKNDLLWFFRHYPEVLRRMRSIVMVKLDRLSQSEKSEAMDYTASGKIGETLEALAKKRILEHPEFRYNAYKYK